MATQPLIWIGFSLFVLSVLALGLRVFHRKAHTPPSEPGNQASACKQHEPQRSRGTDSSSAPES